MDGQSISDASSKAAEDRPSPSSPEVPQMPMVAPLELNADTDADRGHEFMCNYCGNMHARAWNQNTQESELRYINLLGYYGSGAVYPNPGSYGMVQPVPVSTDLHLGWAAPDPRNVVHQSTGHVQNLDLNLHLSNLRPAYPDLSVFSATRIRPRGGEDHQDEDDSGIDLSLKL